MRKELVCPTLAVVLGGVGFGLRRWELATAFEPSGLVTPGMPATIALAVLSAAAAVLFLLLSLGKHGDFPGGYGQAFAAGGNALYMGGMVLSAFLLLGAAGLKLASLPALFREAVYKAAEGQGGNPVLSMLLPVILAALSAVTAMCVLSAGQKCYRGLPMEKYSFRVLTPAYLLCLWLIDAYQSCAADPVLQDYIYELLAIICALLAVYYMASFSFEKPKTARTICFSLLAVYFGLTTLADGHDWPTMALYGFAIIYLLTNVTVLLYQDGRPCPPIPSPEAGAETEEHETEGNPNE